MFVNKRLSPYTNIKLCMGLISFNVMKQRRFKYLFNDFLDNVDTHTITYLFAHLSITNNDFESIAETL